MVLRHLVIAFLLSLLGGLAGACANPASDAEVTFLLAKRQGLDVSRSLEWTFQVEGVPAASVKALEDALMASGFSDVTLPEDDADNDAGSFSVWFSDVRVHTEASLAERIRVVNALTEVHGGRLEYQSVSPPGGAP